MTVETFVVVVLMLVVKYTIEFAERKRLRGGRRISAPRSVRSQAAPMVIDFPGEAAAPADLDAPPPAMDTADVREEPADHAPTGDPFWDMVTARMRDADKSPSTASN